MYVTRPLSLYKNSSSALSLPLPEGPNTGILVIQDEADDAASTSCFGFCRDRGVKVLPFPQNKNLELYYSISLGENGEYVDLFYGVLIPVLNQPLSSNQYYIIKYRGKRKGLAFTSSKEEDKKTCCFFRCVRDIPPQPFAPKNAYQQFKISNYTSCGDPCGFVAKSVGNDGFPPKFLREKGWQVEAKALKNFTPREALGLDAALRARLPEFTFPLPSKSSEPVVVGRWYCPFIFVREGSVDTQVKESTYYEMTLEQNWEEVFGCERKGGNSVDVDVSVQRQGVSVGGSMADSKKIVVADEVMWFEPLKVGLSLAIVERVKWEQERGGFEWGEGGERERVRRREKHGEIGVWRRFGCYVLVERYVLRRMNGSMVLTWEFKHTHQIRSKWE